MYRILIVDDIAQNIQLIGAVLKAQGYKISFAQNGQQALDVIQSYEFDLILLDIMMPGIDGFETIQRIKQIPAYKEVPVIFLTAKEDADSVAKGFELGGVDYIKKPFNKTELLARIKTHLTIKKQKDDLKKLNDTKDMFFSIISHDLKNPFHTLIGLTELLIDSKDLFSPEEEKKALTEMHHTAKHTYSLFDNILQWAKLNQGRLEPTFQIETLPDIINSELELLKAQATKKKINISTELAKMPEIEVDKNMIKTIIRNLVSNAIKFTKNGGTVTIKSIDQNQYVELSVSDNGIGIAPEYQNEIFYQKHKATYGTNNEKGTGLGLYLVKELVELHNGKITVESELDKGTIFRIQLPYNQSDN